MRAPSAMEMCLETGNLVNARARLLFVGPWIGELGHELGFVAMARHAAKDHHRVIACSRPASAPLYEDFVDEFVPHDIKCEGVIASATAATRPSAKLLVRYVPSDAQQFVPREYHGRSKTIWHRYGRHKKAYAGAVVIHARNRPHVPERNWSQRNWNKLARRLVREGVAKRLICIGLSEHALTVEGAMDMRDTTLDVQMDVLASARFIIGPSSGPVHLATLCCGNRKEGCPQLTWCGGAAGERDRTRRRYISEWNPFRTLAHAQRHASWQPTFEKVWAWVTAFVKELPR